MAESTLELEPLFCGCTYQYQFAFTDDDTGAAIDLSAYSAEMNIESLYPLKDTLLELSSAGGELVISGAAGRVTLLIAAEATEEFEDCDAVWDLVLRSASHIWCPIGGTIKIRRPVTHG